MAARADLPDHEAVDDAPIGFGTGAGLDPWGGLRLVGVETAAGADEAPAVPVRPRVELIGTHLRAEGAVDLGHFKRLSDYVNLLEGFFTIHDVVLLSRLGEPTRITFPDFRARLDDIALVGQRMSPPVRGSDEFYVRKDRRRLVITTAAHIVYGYAYIHEQASTMAFLDSPDPHFVPMTNVRVRWLADRRLAGRFAFALIQRPHIIGVATEVSGGLSLLTGRHRNGVVAEALGASEEAPAAAAVSADLGW